METTESAPAGSDRARSDLHIRGAGPDDMPGLVKLWHEAFTMPPDAVARIPQRTRLDRVLVAVDGSRVVGAAQNFSLLQWFGGRALRTAGVASVATDPLYRGAHTASEVVAHLLRAARDSGHDLSTLFPATVPVYRRLGYEYSGVHTTYRLRIRTIPEEATRAPGVVEMGEDLTPLKASFRRLAERENGLTEGVDQDWWDNRVLGRSRAGPLGAVRTDEDVPEAYATYRQEDLPNEWGFRIVCAHMIAHSRQGAMSLLGFFRRFKGLGRDLEWHGPPTEPFTFLLPEPSVTIADTFRFMSRILDVPRALEARGYTASGQATFTVADDLFPDNAGAYRLTVERGEASVERLDDALSPERAIGIGPLTSMFCGYLSPSAAAGLGLAQPDDPALPVFERLFSGPSPWMPDFF